VILFGRLGRAHGVRGDLRFWPNNAESALLKSGRSVFIGRNPEASATFKVQSVRFDAKGAIVHFAGIDDRDAAIALTGQWWYEKREFFPRSADDEVYVVDLIGLRVRTEEGDEIGAVKDVLTTGASDIIVVTDGPREHLIPNVDAFVKSMNLDAGEIIVCPIDGLLNIKGG
jgi:16S rRNA processing protein RimM